MGQAFGYRAMAVATPEDDQRRRLSPLGAMSLVAGSMLGIGIFISPPVVADHIDRPGAFLLIWLLGGLSALFGALSIAELGAMMPRAGGDYPYLRLAYGPGLAFAAGWLQLLAVFPGSLAAMAVGTSEFQLPIMLGDVYDWPRSLGADPVMVWAIALVVGLTAVNHFGVVVSGRLQVVVTAVPVAILLVGTFAVLLYHGTEGGALASAGRDMRMPVMGGFALAFLKVYFAYSGWNAAIYVGGEIRRPGQNLPRALVGGTLGVTVLYLVLCVGFLAVFTMADLANTGEVGTAAARVIFGPWGELLVTLSILFCMLGSINGTILTGSRISYAMACDGQCIPQAGRVHERYGTPTVALWLQAGWTILLMFTHSFEQLIDYASAAMLITGTMTVVAVFVLRRKLRDVPRPYRTWGYPFTPALYVLSSLAVLAVLLAELDPSVFLGVGWFVAAWLFHRLFMRDRPASR
jgi:APA family basic amino acid/polyamine antiporter